MDPRPLGERLAAEPAAGMLRLAVLHGSRARGDARPSSDWDIGVLGDEGLDLAALATAVSGLVGSDAVDVVDLRRASALLRYRAARDAIALLECPPGELERFRLEAVGFWCDAGWVIRRAHDEVLEALG